MPKDNFEGVLKDKLYWWLSKKKPFIINDEYKLELLYVNDKNYTAKILITNLKTNEVQEISNADG